MIKFLQHSSSKYPPRTYENASADATIAFAFDFNTPGEKLTKEAVRTQDKLYLPVDMKILTDGKYGDLRYKNIILSLSDRKVNTINIAGNQLATCLKYSYAQELVDRLIYNFLSHIFNHSEFDANITLIRSGGQSGFDEAGLKAAVRLGIPALCVCPQGWKFADATGKTICDEQAFKNRFPKEFIA